MRRIVKRYYKEFLLRGLCVMCGGPIVLAVIYAILGAVGVIESLSAGEVSLGIITISLLAFLCGGIVVIYKIEELPLVMAILIHGFVIYVAYAVIYLVNGWIKSELEPFLVFTVVFIVGYLIIWAVVYLVTRLNTKRINEKLNK